MLCPSFGGLHLIKIENTHNWLKEQTGNDCTPFITVGHDGWDSKDMDMLGVSIHFTDIANGRKENIAIGTSI